MLAELQLSEGVQTTAWALGLVRSRTFGRVLSRAGRQPAEQQGEEEEEEQVSLLMVPGADLVNHSFDHNSRFEVVLASEDGSSSDAAAVAAGAVTNQQLQLVIKALRPIAAGEEVTISYGADKSNLVLFANYGEWGAPGIWWSLKRCKRTFYCGDEHDRPSSHTHHYHKNAQVSSSRPTRTTASHCRPQSPTPRARPALGGGWQWRLPLGLPLLTVRLRQICHPSQDRIWTLSTRI